MIPAQLSLINSTPALHPLFRNSEREGIRLALRGGPPVTSGVRLAQIELRLRHSGLALAAVGFNRPGVGAKRPRVGHAEIRENCTSGIRHERARLDRG